MIMPGRCHGPGCQREARVEFFCGESCQAAWSRQHAGPTVNAYVPPGRPITSAPPISAPEASSVMEDILRAYDLVRDVQPPGPVKLTREQWHSLRSSQPARTEWELGAIGGLLSGVPVELVATVEESTPYLQAQRNASERFAVGGYIAGPPRDPSDDRIRVLCSPGGWLPYVHGDHSGNHPDDDEDAARRHIAESMDATFRIAQPRGLLPDGAEFPQVASPSPQVAQSDQTRGWLGRWLHRMRRTQ